MISKWMNFKGCENTGALLLRLAVGVPFAVHGWAKVSNMAGTIEFFSSLGLASFWAYLVAYVELLGGVALILGVLTSLAGLLLAINMLVAIILVKFEKGFLGGYELDFILLVSSLAIVMLKGGKFSLDDKLFKKGDSPQM